jgi:hypothetical protein
MLFAPSFFTHRTARGGLAPPSCESPSLVSCLFRVNSLASRFGKFFVSELISRRWPCSLLK